MLELELCLCLDWELEFEFWGMEVGDGDVGWEF